MKKEERWAKEMEVYDFLAKEAGKGRTPSVREIAKAVGFASTGTVQRYLLEMEENGLIERCPGLKRSLRVIPQEGSENDVYAVIRVKTGKALPGAVISGQVVKVIKSAEAIL